MRIGLFGGSFDPFHLGHFLIARTALEEHGLQKIVFLPCAQSPLKRARPVAGDGPRLAMLKKGLKGHDWAEISNWEIQQGGVSYTVDTARRWQKSHPRSQLFWIMGSDQWDLLSSWKEPSELRRILRFLVFPRPRAPRSRRGFRMNEIPWRLDISATQIRSRLGKGLSIEGLVLPSVALMIRRNGWYR